MGDFKNNIDILLICKGHVDTKKHSNTVDALSAYISSITGTNDTTAEAVLYYLEETATLLFDTMQYRAMLKAIKDEIMASATQTFSAAFLIQQYIIQFRVLKLPDVLRVLVNEYADNLKEPII